MELKLILLLVMNINQILKSKFLYYNIFRYCEIDYNKLKTKYSLFAVAVHQGSSVNTGHYYSYVKRGFNWYYCNDDCIKTISENGALITNAYLLLFQRDN